MAFNRFENGNKAKTVKTATVEGDKPRNTPWATIEANGANGYILHIGVNGVTAYDLRPQDRVFLSFDPETHRIGIQRSPDGDHVLSPHGGNPRRLKMSITAFYRANLEGYHLSLPFKSGVNQADGRTRQTFILTLPEPKTRKPRSDAGVKRGPRIAPVPFAPTKLVV